jgi:hypothetical protein
MCQTPLHPGRTVARRVDGQSLVKLSKRDIHRICEVGLEQTLCRRCRIACAEQERLAYGLESRLCGVRGARSSSPRPGERLVEMAALPRDPPCEKRGDRKGLRCLVGSLQHLEPLGFALRTGSSLHRFDASERSANACTPFVGQCAELGREVGRLERGECAQRRLAARIDRPSDLECFECASRGSPPQGEQGRGMGTGCTIAIRPARSRPSFERAAHVVESTASNRAFEGDAPSRRWRVIIELA